MLYKLKYLFRKRKFNKECPDVRCDCCNYYFYNEHNRGCCTLKEKYKLSQLYKRITANNYKREF